jgi:hypothetical protein
MIKFAVEVQADHEYVKKLIDLSQSPQRKIKKPCDLPPGRRPYGPEAAGSAR